MSEKNGMLIYGYGNTGRQDDGVGDAMIELAENWAGEQKLKQVRFMSRFQLMVEDITLMRGNELVIFVDASVKQDISSFAFERVDPDPHPAFTMHAVSPGFLLALYEEMYGETLPVYLLHVRGYEWEFGKEISPRARSNLQDAWQALREVMINPRNLVSGEQ